MDTLHDTPAPPPVPQTWWERWVEPPLLRWLTYWHGRGVPEQEGYYRCVGCHRLVSWKAIRKGGCTCGMSRKLTTTHLRWWEKVRLVLLPWWIVR